MRIAVSAVLAAMLAAGGAASLQIAYTPEASAQGPGSTTVVRTAYTVEPFAPAQPITIQGQGVRLRAEPFATKETQVLSSGSTGLQLTVVGIARQPDWDWYQVVLKNGQKAYIRSDFTSAPSRGGAASASLPRPAQPPVQPPVAPVYQPQTPPPIAVIPTAPAVAAGPAQPLPPIPTQPPASQPLNSGGAISLTPGASTPPRSAVAMTPAHAPVDNGLLSVSPTAPAPRFSDPAPAPAIDPAAPVAAPVSTPSTLSGLGVAEQIRAQLNIKGCWTDSSAMMDAHRLRAAFGVKFGPDGKFAAEPRLITPASEPANDPAMMVFVAKARAALRTCNAMGFSVPQTYYSGGQGELQLDFSAR